MYAWNEIIASLRPEPIGSFVRVWKWQVQHPLDALMTPTVGSPIGQRADFRRMIDADTAIHVRDFGDYYDAQLSIVHPFWRNSALAVQGVPSDPARETPGLTILGATAIGALLGAVLGSKEGAAAGAAIGGLAGLAAVGVSNAESSPATAQAAKDMLESLARAMANASSAPNKGPSRPVVEAKSTKSNLLRGASPTPARK